MKTNILLLLITFTVSINVISQTINYNLRLTNASNPASPQVFCSYDLDTLNVSSAETVPTAITIIKGDSIPCKGVATKFEVPFWNVVSYTWRVTNGSFINTIQPNVIYVTALYNSNAVVTCNYFNSLTNCGGRADFNVNITPKTFIIANTNTICKGDSVQWIATGNTNNYWQWEITKPNATKIYKAAEDTLTFKPTEAGDYTISIVGSGLCGSNTIALKVFDTPAPADTIKGIDSVCTNETYSYKIAHPQADVTYNWYLKANTVTAAEFVGLNTGKEVNIKYSSGAANFYTLIKVIATNDNNCTSDTTYLSITRQVMRSGFVNADTVACPDTRVEYEAKYKEGESYEWSISPAGAGSIVTGNGTAKATILWNHIYTGISATILLKIRKCGSLNPTSKTIYIKPAPRLQLITPSNAVCRGSQFTASLQTNTGSSLDANILWSLGNGDSSKTIGNSIDYQYNAAIVAPVKLTISATVSNVQYLGCTYADANTITQHITVNPTPEITTDKQGGYYVVTIGGAINEPIKATINPQFGQPDSLIWLMPSGSIGCITPTYSCIQQTLTTVGNYYVTAKNNTGCQSSSSVVQVLNPITIPPGCNRLAPYKCSFDTVLNCGLLNYKADFNGVSHNSLWLIGNKFFSIEDSGAYYVEKIGIYGVLYSPSITYYDTARKITINCLQPSIFKKVALPVLPKLEQKVSCKSDGRGYVLKATETSNKLDSTSNIVYNFYIDSVLQQSGSSARYTDSSFALGSSHKLYVVVNYTFKGIAGSCYTAAQTFNIPQPNSLPDAGFSIAATPIDKHCEGLTLKLQPDSAFNPANSYYWRFGDQSESILYNPEKNYVHRPLAYQPSLQVSNGLGCTITSEQNWTVVQNNLRGGIEEQGNNFLCPNAKFSINYAPDPSTTNPNSYVWFNARNPILRQYSDSGTNNPYSIIQTGSYWVRVQDDYGCAKPIDGNAVVIFAPVAAPIISSSPATNAGNDTLNICSNDSKGFTLKTSPNLVHYTWLQDGLDVNVNANTISISPDSLTIGLHSYKVLTTVDIGTSICDTASKFFYVRINPAPDKPVITIGAVNCNSYDIELIATSSANGIFNWSNGDVTFNNTSSSTTVGQGGIYGVTVNTGSVCSSQADIIIPDNPQNYLSYLPKGCYNVCIDTNVLIIPMPPSPIFAQWQWLMNIGTGYNAFTTGYNSSVPNLLLYNAGDYLLSVNNGLCTFTTTEPISIHQPDAGCQSKEQQCNFVVNSQSIKVLWNCSCDTAEVIYTIQNKNNYPVAYTINGDIILPGGVANSGSNTYRSIYTTAQNGVGVFKINFNFYYTVGIKTQVCRIPAIIEIDNCPSCKQALSHLYSKKATPIVNAKLISIVPNPANSVINIRVDTSIGEGDIVIIGYLGNIVKRQRINNQSAIINIQDLPNGLYIVQVIGKNGKASSDKFIKD